MVYRGVFDVTNAVMRPNTGFERRQEPAEAELGHAT